MKHLFLGILTSLLLLVSFGSTAHANVEIGVEYSGVANNISIGGTAANESSNVKKNDKLQEFNDKSQFIKVARGGEKGLFNTLIQFARDLKNLFYAIATVYFLVIALRLIFTSNTEEELAKFKKGIIWITIGLILMQLAFAFTKIIFDQGVSARLGASIIEYLVWPMITLIQTLASIFFVAMAIFAFYRLITANGNEEAIKSGKMSIVYALIGFMIVRFAKGLVEAFYGRINCESFSVGFITFDGETCVNRLDISEGANIIISVINWLNGFVALVVLIMVIYAGSQILLSAGDEEKIKKGKQSIVYIAIGLAVLVLNYLLLTFFLRPEAII